MNADKQFKNGELKAEIVFQLMRFASFVLHMDCLPACNQSQFKCDWLKVPKLQTETFQYVNLVLLQNLFIKIILFTKQLWKRLIGVNIAFPELYNLTIRW